MDLWVSIQNQTSVAMLLTKHLLSNEAKKSNCVFSPLSICTVLSLVASGSKGSTRSQLLSFLKSDSTQSLASFASHIESTVLTDGSPSGGPKLSSATRLWIQNSFSLKPSFKHVIETSYKASSAVADFINKHDEAISEVNSWVKKKTNGLIKEILPADSVNSLTRLILANALYFKGIWKSKFDAEDTEDGNFNLLDGSVIRVPFMTSNKKQYVSSHDGYKVLRLPYDQGNDGRKFSMYIMLPNAKDGLPSFIRSLSEAQFMLKNVAQRQVEVGDFKIPRFRITYELEASEMLKRMKLTLPFSQEADFSEMVCDRNIFVSKILHKSFIEVNEEGTEAAAASAVIMQMTSSMISNKMDFVADHPFLFLVREDNSELVLFSGQIVNPSQSS